jgi:hypothetical protein
MKKNLFQKVNTAVLGSLSMISACTSVYAAEAPKDDINEWIESCPHIGLVAKEVNYGPITLKKLDLDNNGRVVIAQPGETIKGSVQYKVDAEELKSLHLHHIILGIKSGEAQSCITHALGIWDAKGTAHFSLIAPFNKGVYEILFDYQTGVSCKNALEEWRKNPPSSKAVVGIIIVE